MFYIHLIGTDFYYKVYNVIIKDNGEIKFLIHDLDQGWVCIDCYDSEPIDIRK